MPLAITGIVEPFWHGAASLHDKLDYLSGYVIFPLTIVALFATLIIYLKIVLSGIAYGWDMAALSVDHAIYVSQGSVANPTEVYTLAYLLGTTARMHGRRTFMKTSSRMVLAAQP